MVTEQSSTDWLAVCASDFIGDLTSLLPLFVRSKSVWVQVRKLKPHTQPKPKKARMNRP